MYVRHYYDLKFLKIHLIDSNVSLLCYVDLCTTIPKDNWKFDIGNKQAIQEVETNLKQTKIVESGIWNGHKNSNPMKSRCLLLNDFHSNTN